MVCAWCWRWIDWDSRHPCCAKWFFIDSSVVRDLHPWVIKELVQYQGDLWAAACGECVATGQHSPCQSDVEDDINDKGKGKGKELPVEDPTGGSKKLPVEHPKPKKPTIAKGLKGQRGSNGGGSLDKTAATKVATKKEPTIAKGKELPAEDPTKKPKK